MTQEEKDLLLKDLCARLPYGVKCVFRSTQGDIPSTVVRIDKEAEMVIHRPDGQKIEYFYFIEDGMFKPYLRPLSNMTQYESRHYDVYLEELSLRPSIENADDLMCWLYENHFDCHNLIEKGLALEAPEGMYSK